MREGTDREYKRILRESVDNPEKFWLDAARSVDWTKQPDAAHTMENGWYPGGTLNTCYNCVDRHIEAGRGEQTAFIHVSPVTGSETGWTYAQLLDEVNRVTKMLVRLGIGKGDRVVIYMPMIPQAMFAMLACARIGAIHSVVFGGFAPLELAKRIDDAAPGLLLTASCGIEGGRTIAYKPLVDEALQLASHKIPHLVVYQREMAQAELEKPRDSDWEELASAAENDPDVPCAEMASSDPLYILYTSGTTGIPKGVVRENGGHAVALAWSMTHIYGVGAGDVFWAASDIGWVVGHSYIVYAPLLVGATTIMFEGKPVGTPDPGTFWRVMTRHNVKCFFTAPTAIRAIRKEDPDAGFLAQIGTGNLEVIFLAGERADPDTIHWLEEKSGLPVIDHWWQTELGWPAIATCFGLGDMRRRPGSAGFPVPGYQFAVLGEDGSPLPDGESGAIVIREPLAPGAFRTLWNNHAAYEKNFGAYPGYYETGDAGHIDADGFINIMGRTDDIINVAGHRLSTGQMEQIVAAQDGVAEAAVIGAQDNIKGMIPVAFAVARAGAKGGDEMMEQIIAAVRGELGAVAALKRVYLIQALPKTRSGKILRNVLRKIVDGEDYTIPATIEDASVLDVIAATVREPA
ncbi:MAG: AMP-binding protein [Sphingomonadaceae bacterium]